MTDIVERLRGWPLSVNGPHTDRLCHEAADLIEALLIANYYIPATTSEYVKAQNDLRRLLPREGSSDG